MSLPNYLHITTSHQQTQLLVHGIPVSDALALPAIIIAAFAAWEAAKSARATAQANIQAVLPVLTLKYVPEQGMLAGHVMIKNTGQGQAFNIYIPSYKMFWYEPNIPAFNVTTELKLRASPDDLSPGQERRLVSEELEAGQPVHGRGLLTSIIMGHHRRFRVPILFRDVVGKRYITYVETGRSQVRILQPSRRFGVLEKVRYYSQYEIYYFIKEYYRYRQFQRRKRTGNCGQT